MKEKLNFMEWPHGSVFELRIMILNIFLLEDIVAMAKNIGGNDHGFKFIQLPYNMNYDQALLGKNQLIQNKPVSILEAAVTLGIGVFTSVPFMQGRLLAIS